MQDLLKSLSGLDPLWIYAVIFLIAYIENIFPPSPSDIIIVFGGALAAIGRGTFYMALLAGTLGSTLGFMTMYWIGIWFGKRIIEAGRIKFIPLDNVHKLEGWFSRFGYWIIVVNRFLAGTRAVVSFFAGISRLDLFRTVVLSFVSSLAWYSLLIYAGYTLGRHWERFMLYLTTYSQIVTGFILVVLVIILVRYLMRRNGNRKSNG